MLGNVCINFIGVKILQTMINWTVYRNIYLNDNPTWWNIHWLKNRKEMNLNRHVLKFVMYINYSHTGLQESRTQKIYEELRMILNHQKNGAWWLKIDSYLRDKVKGKIDMQLTKVKAILWSLRFKRLIHSDWCFLRVSAQHQDTIKRR